VIAARMMVTADGIDQRRVADFLAAQFGDWKLLFLVFGVVSVLAVLWLGSSKIEETRVEGYKATFCMYSLYVCPLLIVRQSTMFTTEIEI